MSDTMDVDQLGLIGSVESRGSGSQGVKTGGFPPARATSPHNQWCRGTDSTIVRLDGRNAAVLRCPVTCHFVMPAARAESQTSVGLGVEKKKVFPTTQLAGSVICAPSQRCETPITMRIVPCRMYSFVFLALLLASRVDSQPKADGLATVRKIFPGDTAVDRLRSGKPLKGVLRRGESMLLRFGVPEKKGFGFPDIALALDVDNPGGDADLYCLPGPTAENSGFRPSASWFVWKSDHLHAIDTIFLSRNQTAFDESIVERETEDGEVALSAEFYCTVYGHSSAPSNFRLTLNVNYESRELVAKEQKAMEGIYDACCPTNDTCQGWVRLFKWSFETDSDDPSFDFCHMYNSFCNEKGHLIRLDMNKFGMECDVPIAQIKKLKKLRKLILNQNRLTGDIDKIARELQGLPNLDEFSIKDNEIDGSLSTEDDLGDIGICGLVERNLGHLNLGINNVTGPIPPCLFGESSKLVNLFVGLNPINSPIPDAFSENSLLQIISMVDTGITGKFPVSLAKVPNLVRIDLRKNSIEGTLPKGMGQTGVLMTVDLDHNQLSGEIPLSLLEEPTLNSLSLMNNSFTSLPDGWSLKAAKASSLVQLNLAFNDIEGKVPKAMVSFPNMTIFTIQGNKFSGGLPDFKNMFPKALLVDFSKNKFTGTIPESWGDFGVWKGLSTLGILIRAPINVSDNDLSGPLPDFLLFKPVPPNLVPRGFDISGNRFDCVRNNSLALFHIGGLEDCVDADAPAPGPEGEELAPAPIVAPSPAPEAAGVGSDSDSISTATVVEGPVTPAPAATNAIDRQGQSSRELSSDAQAGLLQAGQVERVENNNDTKSSSVSGVAIIVIVVVVVVVLGAAIFMAVIIKKRRSQNAAAGGGIGENEMELGAAGNEQAIRGTKFEAFHEDVDGARNVRMEGIGNS